MITEETKARIAQEAELPDFETIESKPISELSAIEIFIFNHEPVDGVDFRKGLKKVIIEAKEAEHECSKGQWASVEELLPDKNKLVLVVRSSGYMLCKCWEPYTNQDEKWFRENFTHWRPLPELPNTITMVNK